MIKDKEMVLDKESILDKEPIRDKEMIQETIQEMMSRMFPWTFEDKLVAIGKVDSDGTILKGTRGISVFHLGNDEAMYVVRLPEGLVTSEHYIVQLTVETLQEDGDWHPTTIGLHDQTRHGFLVRTYGRHNEATRFSEVQIPWSFSIFERRMKFYDRTRDNVL